VLGARHELRHHGNVSAGSLAFVQLSPDCERPNAAVTTRKIMITTG
jgi:hypothetical protein